MAPDPRDRSSLIISALIALAAVVVLGVALLVSRGEREPEPTTAPTAPTAPSASPEPEPEPEPEPPAPVEGGYELTEVVELSATGTGLYAAGTGGDAPVVTDDAAVTDFVAAMAIWLDDHLTDLQDGGEGAAASAGLSGPIEVVHLTDPEHPVAAASYLVRVGARGDPEWGEVQVSVERQDGSVRTATLALLPGEDAPRLVAAEGDATAPASGPDEVATTDEDSESEGGA
jgi:hypothetical protein